MIETTARERRTKSQKAEIVSPRQGLRLPRPIRRLRRNAPMYAVQGLSALSTRLRELTGREVIDVGKVMGLSGERVRLIEREALRKLRHSEIINAAGWI